MKRILETGYAPGLRGVKRFTALLIVVALSPLVGAQQPNGFAAPGRIEGASPTVRSGFPIMGVVKEVQVKPGSRVTKGAILASLICDDRTANIAAAEADLADARAGLAKFKKGAREE